MPHSIYKNIDTMFDYVERATDNMMKLLSNLEHQQENTIITSYNCEREINNLRNILRSNNISNINEHHYEYQSGIYYMDIICESERLCDYIVNVVDCVRAQTEAEA